MKTGTWIAIALGAAGLAGALWWLNQPAPGASVATPAPQSVDTMYMVSMYNVNTTAGEAHYAPTAGAATSDGQKAAYSGQWTHVVVQDPSGNTIYEYGS